MRGVRFGKILLLALALVAATTAAVGASAQAPRPLVTVPPPTGIRPAESGAICYFGACYNYVSSGQYVSAIGASVDMYQARPELDPGDPQAHSLQELAVESADGQQIVEMGWTVDRGLNGDLAPHLFVFHWVAGQPTCYNACGFVSTSSIKPGQQLKASTVATYAIVNRSGNWWILYNGERIGYFPGSIWTGHFTRTNLVQVFGEVASSEPTSCSDMGNGRAGSLVGSSLVANFRQIEGITPARFTFALVTTRAAYDSGFQTSRSYHLGGRGTGLCLASG